MQGLRVVYGQHTAVDDVSFTVSPGEIVGLVGPNGAGKTTTTLAISGLIKPTSGTVVLLGETGALSKRARSRFALAGQEISLYRPLTVRQNMDFFGRLHGIGSKVRQAEMEGLAEELGLVDIIDRPVAELSGGQQRLAHVASSLVHRPAVAILDEPSAGLDPFARAALLDLVRKRAADGMAVLFSSHYLNEVEDVSDTIVMMHSGRVLAKGSLAEVIGAHCSPHVEILSEETTHRYPGSDIRAAMRAHGRKPIDNLRLVGPSLEGAFISLTGGPLQDGEGHEVGDEGGVPA